MDIFQNETIFKMQLSNWNSQNLKIFEKDKNGQKANKLENEEMRLKKHPTTI